MTTNYMYIYIYMLVQSHWSSLLIVHCDLLLMYTSLMYTLPMLFVRNEFTYGPTPLPDNRVELSLVVLESWPYYTTGSSDRTCLDAEDVRLDSRSSGTEYDSTQLNSTRLSGSGAGLLDAFKYPLFTLQY